MVFSSSVFLILFLPLTVIAYYNPLTDLLCKRFRGFRNAILLTASLVFYAWGEPIYVFLMILSIVVTYFVGLGIASIRITKQKTMLVLGVIYHVLTLFIFKYSTFLISQLDLIGGLKRDPTWSIALPIGISFYTFQLLSYLFDVYYKKTDVQKNLFSLALYATMFPQLIAGPIVRYSSISCEIAYRPHERQDFYEGTERFIFGLGKKVLIADQLAYAADIIWTLETRSVYVSWIGAIAYTLQIYYDFSGYSDMAIGLGRLFGFRFSENFKYPYIAKSVTEFWRRWHISLSSWFRDYVYIPMGGNRVSKGKWVRNIFVVWLLTGIWHGANWTFLCWGLTYFVVLMLEKFTGYSGKTHVLSHLYTLLVVTLAWVMFRSESITDGLMYIGGMFGIGNADMTTPPAINLLIAGIISIMLVAVVLSTPLIPYLFSGLRQNFPRVYALVYPIVTICIFIFSISKVMAQNYTAFIYFDF